MLSAGCPVKVIPTRWVGPLKDSDNEKVLIKATTIGSTAPPAMGSVPHVGFNQQPRMLFGTAVNYRQQRLFGTVALALLKVLKNT